MQWTIKVDLIEKERICFWKAGSESQRKGIEADRAEYWEIRRIKEI